MKRLFLAAVLILFAGLVWLVYGIVDEYMRPYKKVTIRCDAGRNG